MNKTVWNFFCSWNTRIQNTLDCWKSLKYWNYFFICCLSFHRFYPFRPSSQILILILFPLTLSTVAEKFSIRFQNSNLHNKKCCKIWLQVYNLHFRVVHPHCYIKFQYIQWFFLSARIPWIYKKLNQVNLEKKVVSDINN